MSLNRRTFLKGLSAAAIAVSVPLGTLEAIVSVCNKENIEIFYVRPELWLEYERLLPLKMRWCNTKLADKGLDSLMFKGYPIVPFPTKDLIPVFKEFGDIKQPKDVKNLYNSFIAVIKYLQEEEKERVKKIWNNSIGNYPEDY